MALLFMDSFDHYATADILEKWTAHTSATIVAGAGRNSTAGYRGSAASRNISKGLNTSSTTIILAAAVKLGALNQAFFNIGEATVTHLVAFAAADGAIQIWRPTVGGWISTGTGGGATMIATSVPGLLSVGVYGHLQVKVVIDDTAGSVDVRLNDAAVVTGSSLDTRNAGSGLGNLIYIGGQHDIDDVWVCDGTGPAPWNTFLGDCRVDARYPTAAGATTGWAPSAGANWQCVDETAPNDDTDYTVAAAAGVTDTFTVQDAPVAGAAIYGVQLNLSAKKTDAGAASIAAVIRHSGVDYVGADLNPSTVYAVHQHIAATNPGTAAQWTDAGFNAAEFGYRRTV